MKIAISSKSGSGNTTLSSLLSKELNFTLINYTLRSIAREKGLSFREFYKEVIEDESHYWDLYLDKKQVKLAKESSNCILASRLSIWLLREADFKVYLKAPLELRARRIMQREGESDFESVFEKTKMRDERDRKRYLKLYNIDIDLFEGEADLILDTSEHSPLELVELIKAKMIKNKRRVL